jgi:hypothetical protein
MGGVGTAVAGAAAQLDALTAEDAEAAARCARLPKRERRKVRLRASRNQNKQTNEQTRPARMRARCAPCRDAPWARGHCGRWQLFDAHMSALVSAAFAALAALIEERVRHLRQPL